MKTVCNIRYCQFCGGITQWEEFDPTVCSGLGASIGAVIKPTPQQTFQAGIANFVLNTGILTTKVCECHHFSGTIY